MNAGIVLKRWLLMSLFWAVPLVLYGQPKSGHFVYRLISYEIIDSSHFSKEDAASFADYMKDDYSADIYFNKAWVVVLRDKPDGTGKSMYNRKSRILYTYFDGEDVKKMRIDSIQALKLNDSKLLEAIDTLKADLQVTEYPNETRRIHGFPCHKVTTSELGYAPILDEVWIAEFANVPNLIFPDHLYFLIEGIPLEIVQDFDDIKFKWGVVEVLPAKSGNEIFKQSSDGYEVSVDDTEKLIYECIHFIRTYQPKSD